MFTETLNNWQPLLASEMRGEKVEIDPIYAKFYEEWKKTKEEMLPKLSAAERVQLLSDDVGYETQRRIETLISKKWMSSDKKQVMKSEAQHGDLCLVSTDDGKHFDKALTLEELLPLDPLTVRFFSPTLQSVTNNYERLKEEQNLLCVSKNLRGNHCLVERGYIENHVVHIDIVHQKMEACEVEVDLKKVASARNYIFKAKDGSQNSVVESQLPEEFGEIKPPISKEVATPLNAIYLMAPQQEAKDENLDATTNAAIATYSSLMALSKLGAEASERAKALSKWNQIQNQPKDRSDVARVAMARELLLDQAQMLQTAASKFSANVMESKAAVVARMLEKQQQIQAEKEHYIQAVRAHEVAQRKMVAEQQAARAKQKSIYAQAQKARKVVAAVGSAVTGGAIGGFGFLGFWISHLNSH